jgi:hypothetical protein
MIKQAGVPLTMRTAGHVYPVTGVLTERPGQLE